VTAAPKPDSRHGHNSCQSTHRFCWKMAIAELTTWSNALPTDSTNLRVTMQHKTATALIWATVVLWISSSHILDHYLNQGCKQRISCVYRMRVPPWCHLAIYTFTSLSMSWGMWAGFICTHILSLWNPPSGARWTWLLWQLFLCCCSKWGACSI